MPSAWNWFTGAGKAQKQAIETANTNKGYINSGLDKQLGYYGGARDAASGYMQPYAQQGMAGQTAYTNALGINGAAGRQSALSMYGGGSSPWLDESIGLAQRAGDRRAAATGQFNSGINALARNRVATEMGTQDYNNWLSQLQGVGQQGYNAAGAMAGNEWNYANAAGNAQAGATQGLVGNNTQLGNSLAASQISPMNYVMQNAQMAISAMGGRPGGGGSNNYGSYGGRR